MKGCEKGLTDDRCCRLQYLRTTEYRTIGGLRRGCVLQYGYLLITVLHGAARSAPGRDPQRIGSGSAQRVQGAMRMGFIGLKVLQSLNFCSSHNNSRVVPTMCCKGHSVAHHHTRPAAIRAGGIGPQRRVHEVFQSDFARESRGAAGLLR